MPRPGARSAALPGNGIGGAPSEPPGDYDELPAESTVVDDRLSAQVNRPAPPMLSTGTEAALDAGDALAGAPTLIGAEVHLPPPPRPLVSLAVETGADVGRAFELTPGHAMIGRGIDNQVVLTDIAVSRRHVILIVDPAGLRVRDMGSGNGTLVNGVRVVGDAPIAHGDRLEIGNTVLRVDLSGHPPLAAGTQAVAPSGVPVAVYQGPTGAIASPGPDPGLYASASAQLLPGAEAGQSLSRIDLRPRNRRRLAIFGGAGVGLVGAIVIAIASSRGGGESTVRSTEASLTTRGERERSASEPKPAAEPAPAPTPPKTPEGAEQVGLALYKERRFSQAAAVLRSFGDHPEAGARLTALARDYEAVGKALDSGATATGPVLALAAYRDAARLDRRATKGLLERHIQERIDAVAGKAAQALFDGGMLVEARAACDEGHGPEVEKVRRALEEKAAVLYADAGRMAARDPAEARKLYGQVIAIVPASSPWHAKASDALRSSGRTGKEGRPDRKVRPKSGKSSGKSTGKSTGKTARPSKKPGPSTKTTTAPKGKVPAGGKPGGATRPGSGGKPVVKPVPRTGAKPAPARRPTRPLDEDE